MRMGQGQSVSSDQAIEDIMRQRMTAQSAMDAMRGAPSEPPLTQIPSFGGLPPGVDPRSMIDVGPEQGLPGGINRQDMMQRLRGY